MVTFLKAGNAKAMGMQKRLQPLPPYHSCHIGPSSLFQCNGEVHYAILMPLVVEMTKLINADGQQIHYDKHLISSSAGLQD